MRLIKAAAAVINQTPFDWSGNVLRLKNAICDARARDVSLLCLPELCISGYGCEDAFYMPNLSVRALECLCELVPLTSGMIVSLGLPFVHRGALFNVIAVAIDGQLVAIVPKKMLAGDGVHYEPRWFKAWPSGVVERAVVGGKEIPIGDVFINCGDIKIGFEICEEAWAADRTGAHLAKVAVDIVMNPSASHFSFGKRHVRERFVAEGSRAFHVAYLYSNLLGNESGRIIFDGGALIASEGSIVNYGPRFSFKDHEITDALVDVDINRMMRSKTGSYEPLMGREQMNAVEVKFAWPKLKSAATRPAQGAGHWEQSPDLKAEEFSRAVALGLFDFLRKSHLNGFTISISGGVDSAAATVLAVDALKFAVAELGVQGVKSRLGHINAIQSNITVHDLVRELVSTAYQATSNSSPRTEAAAAALAKELGVSFYRWSVESMLADYKKTLSEATGTTWDWQRHDVILQNIQARSRGPAIWMLANLKNHLLLATSNRSEAAVGYATMDGDTCGGLSPLAGIDKAYLREWLRWREFRGPEGIGPLKSLAFVNEIPPTAELRPEEFKQTDEADLMPYDVLDVIERAAIRDKKSPVEVLATLSEAFPAHSFDDKRQWVKRFFTLWCRNQWKRERYAPGFQLDDESVDPKTWCRFPILSGAFAEELRELDVN